jgi:hypothetical protein
MTELSSAIEILMFSIRTKTLIMNVVCFEKSNYIRLKIDFRQNHMLLFFLNNFRY